MHRLLRPLTCVVLLFSLPSLLWGQDTSETISVPRLVRYSGIATDESGTPLTGVLDLTIAMYKEQAGGAPLWMETQKVTGGCQWPFRCDSGSDEK